MSTKWSYSGDPSSSTLDAVRFGIGDTVAGDPIFTDAEITFAVTSEGSINEATIRLAKAAVAKFARLTSVSDDKIKKENQQKLEHFQALVKELVQNRGKRVTGIFAGGLSISGKKAVESDTDRNAPAFTRTMHDGPLDVTPNSTETEGS